MIRRAPHGVALALALVLLGACSGGGGAAGRGGDQARAPQPVPAREPTAADALLSLLPAGADAVVEIDLARVRANPVVGPLATSLMKAGQGASALGIGAASLEQVDLVVFVAYGLGTKDSATLAVVRGDGVTSWRRGHRMDARTVALGPDALLARLRVTTPKTSLARNTALLSVRTLAMPARAKGASVRIAARLDFDARVSLASTLGVDEVPTSVSVWADVVDDFAMVGLLGAANPKEAVRLAKSTVRWRDALARDAASVRAGLGFLIRRASVERRGSAARTLLVIGPKRLQRYVSRFAGSGE